MDAPVTGTSTSTRAADRSLPAAHHDSCPFPRNYAHRAATEARNGAPVTLGAVSLPSDSLP